MAYTQEFIDKVKRVYPNSKEMHKLAEEGNYFLGRYLDDGRGSAASITFSPEEVINTSSEELIKKAKIAQQKVEFERLKDELYAEFLGGKCFTKEYLHEVQCPMLHMQNNSDPNRYEWEKEICKGVGYVGYYPHCKKWNCKEQCWTKYYELKKET